MTGRKRVLVTIVSSLESAGYRVVVAHFGPCEAADQFGGDAALSSTCCCKYIRLPDPRRLDFAVAVMSRFLTGRCSLNECLYAGGKSVRALRALAVAERAKVVVTDMIRTAPYGQALGLPWVADLDDLLSRRYAQLADTDVSLEEKGGGVFGYREAPLLRRLATLLHPLLQALLRLEARVLERREKEVARAANIVTLVSPKEASDLSSVAGVPVEWMPMAIAGPINIAPTEDRGRNAVFVGGLGYQPNLRAVLDFDRRLAPELARLGLKDFRLDVIGEVDSTTAWGFSPAVRLLEYVDDLDAALQQYRMMLVPGRLSGGIKTKMVHAALNGLIILATPEAVVGTRLRPGQEVLVWQDGQDLATYVARIRRGDAELDGMRIAARTWAETWFSPTVLASRWAKHMRHVTGESYDSL
jgi:hypothetical protein